MSASVSEPKARPRPAAVAAPAAVSRLTRQRIRSAWVFLVPLLVVLTLVAGWPLLRTFWFSFTDATLNADHPTHLVGFANYLHYGPDLKSWDDTLQGYRVRDPATRTKLVYRPTEDAFYDAATNQPYPQQVDRTRVFFWQGVMADPTWWRAVLNTVVLAVISVAIELVLGVIIALTLNAHLPGRGLLRAAVLIPWAIPTIVSAKMWGWMLNDQYGVVNQILLNLGIISGGIAWTANPDYSLPAVIAVDVWKTTPFMTLLILAALQMLPNEIYEAGRVDGISPLRMFFKVTLPLIRPALMVAVIFRALDALRIFDLIYALTSGSRETMSMAFYARQQLVDFQDVGLGSAASTLLFLIIAVITVAYITAGRVNLGER